jgi:hypothetical protein
MKSRNMPALAALCLGLAACSTYQAHSNLPGGTYVAPTSSSQVQVLFSPPQRAYETIGIVSAKRYKPGWTDPSISDAIPQLQAAGAELGADAVVVRSDRALNDRHITVEAEAIRYTDKAGKQAAAPSAADCVSCQTLGKH